MQTHRGIQKKEAGIGIKEEKFEFDEEKYPEDVAKKIADLLNCGVVGVGVAQIVDVLLADEVLLVGFQGNKKKLIVDLHSIVKKFNAAQTKLETRASSGRVENSNMLLDVLWNSFLAKLYAESLISSGRKTEIRAIVDRMEQEIIDIKMNNKTYIRGKILRDKVSRQRRKRR